MEENMQYDDLGTLAQLNWFPGHMAKAKRIIVENLKLVDVVIELRDARIPNSSANPILKDLIGKKPHLIALNKIDLADNNINNKWEEYFTSMGKSVVKINSLDGKGIRQLVTVADELAKVKTAKFANKGVKPRNARVMIVGIPNVGKSTFINKYVGKTTAKTGDKPGVTRGKQWIKLKKDFELLDTPGILWPKFEDQQVGLKLAFTGAINDDILDSQTLATAFINHMMVVNPDCIRKRYNIEFDTIAEPHDVLRQIAEARGFKLKGDEPDLERASKILMDEYRGGKLGRLTLELPEDINDMLAEKEAREKEKAQTDKARKAEYKKRKK